MCDGATQTAIYQCGGFGTQLLNIATAALPYIAGGITAAVVVFAVVYGIRKGVSALRTVGR